MISHTRIGMLVAAALRGDIQASLNNFVSVFASR